jgi:hypothetical protein
MPLSSYLGVALAAFHFGQFDTEQPLQLIRYGAIRDLTKMINDLLLE